MPRGRAPWRHALSARPESRAVATNSGWSSGSSGCAAGPPSSSTTPSSRSERSTGEPAGPPARLEQPLDPARGGVLAAGRVATVWVVVETHLAGSLLPQPDPRLGVGPHAWVVELGGEHGGDPEGEDVAMTFCRKGVQLGDQRDVGLGPGLEQPSSPSGQTPCPGSQGRWECRTRQKEPGTGGVTRHQSAAPSAQVAGRSTRRASFWGASGSSSRSTARSPRPVDVGGEDQPDDLRVPLRLVEREPDARPAPRARRRRSGT